MPIQELQLTPVARIRSDFPAKFGIPRQSGLVPELTAHVVFEPEFRSPDLVRGIEGFSHLWLLWVFSEHIEEGWSPTVRPPRLGGNGRVGLFATRTPFRPNPIGLSAVELLKVESHPEGTILTVGGADLMDGTPIIDIKPYVPTDAIRGFRSGFVDSSPREPIAVEVPPELEARVPPQHRMALRGILAQDPHPAYQHDPARVYSMTFADFEVDFQVNDRRVRVVNIR
ncbi:MAG TPA: tRNA (N6-threonylcarbamoyladenosine(37)-N6)-methyltransferase TrmO [Actinomycetaceae bacterium]|nr:tRNA (N6-threonylcarbamoyladenosine(37)-N6)-methyltransferase TrmO [Actinomycetaceae bacterium]